jgi:hypothetical protein
VSGRRGSGLAEGPDVGVKRRWAGGGGHESNRGYARDDDAKGEEQRCRRGRRHAGAEARSEVEARRIRRRRRGGGGGAGEAGAAEEEIKCICPAFCWSRWNKGRKANTVEGRQMPNCLPKMRFIVGLSLMIKEKRSGSMLIILDSHMA